MDRITRVRIRNVRAIEYVDIELSRPLTVLIGENGSGKSTVLECMELLRKAADPAFLQYFYSIHRGLPSLLRKGATSMELGVVIEDDAGESPRIEYSFALAQQHAGAVVQSELLLVGTTEGAEKLRVVLRRSADQGELFDATTCQVTPVPSAVLQPGRLVIASFGAVPPHGAIERLLHVLGRIEVHLPFDTRASWAARTYQRPESLRVAGTLFPADRLNLLGSNLANAWFALRNLDAAHWEHTMALVRLGLGDRVDSVMVTSDPGGGNVFLSLRFNDLVDPVLAADLSDGQLSWLAFVAMARLHPERTLLAVDEPELHLHPSLLGRVVSMLASLPGGAPVVLSTHSDRVLELLDDPADAVRVCTLSEGRAAVSRIDASVLPRWLEQFGDLGQLRAAGYLERVLEQPTPADPPPGVG